eukprot:7059672-Pyramimonas_sp.AAC.1
MGKKNPLGKDGKPLRCSICDSDDHLRAFCPQKKKRFGSGGEPRMNAGPNNTFANPFLVSHPPP